MKTDYSVFKALDPFFRVILEGLSGLVDGDHFWNAVADDAVFEFLYEFPGWPRRLKGRDEIMKVYAGYGDNISLEGADALVVHRSQDPRVVILEYEVHVRALATGRVYDNRFASVITIENRKIVHWRDYMDSMAAMLVLAPPSPQT